MSMGMLGQDLYNHYNDIGALAQVRGERAHQARAGIVRQRAAYKRANRMYKMYWLVAVLAAGFLGLVSFAPRAAADAVLLDGLITEGEFLSPQFVANPALPGGGSLMNVDQLRLTGTGLEIALHFSDSILNDTLLNGYSFLILDANGATTGSNLSLAGTLGDPSLNGFVFRNQLRSTGDIAEFVNGVFNLSLFVTGSNNGVPFLGASPSGLLTLMSAPVPASVRTVGDLVDFLRTTSLFTSGTFPAEFFIGSAGGGMMLVNTDIAFSLSGSADSVPTPVPLPGAVWLFISGLIGLGAVGRRRRSLARGLA